jgi:hypothetical protein
MSERALQQYRSELQQMNKNAKHMVIFTGLLIHLFMNIYIQIFGSIFLKVEVPVLSVITIAIMVVSGKYFDRHENKQPNF